MADADPTPTGGQEEKKSFEEQIADKVNAGQAEDLVPLDVDASGEFVDTPAKAAEPEEPAPVTETPPPVVAPPEGPKMVSIVVDGQTLEVEESRILEAGKRTLQKTESADRKLQDAARIRREADEYAARLGRPSQDAAPTPAPSQDAPRPLTREEAAELFNSQLYARDANKAARAFEQQFPEIAADQNLMNMARMLEDRRLSVVAALGEDPGDPSEAYRKHGEEIRAWVSKFKPAVEPVSQDKIERKRTITAVPAVNAKAPQPQPDRPQTVQEIIAEERKARLGRPVPIRSH